MMISERDIHLKNKNPATIKRPYLLIRANLANHFEDISFGLTKIRIHPGKTYIRLTYIQGSYILLTVCAVDGVLEGVFSIYLDICVKLKSES